MKLSNQAVGAIMLALQNSLLNQTDIMPVMESWDLELSTDGLVVKNPPTVNFPDEVSLYDDGSETAPPITEGDNTEEASTTSSTFGTYQRPKI